MKKFMILTDMEGMPGVTGWSDVTINSPEHDRFRLQLTNNVCEVCQLLKEKFGEDTNIIVKDGHWTGRNILYENIPAGVTLVTGKITDQPLVMEQMDSSYDGIIFLYFHAPSPTLGNTLAHTESDETYISFELNGRLSSELELLAYEAAFIGVPIFAVTGDAYICNEALSRNFTSRVVVTKTSYGGSIESRSCSDILSDIHKLILNYDIGDDVHIKIPEKFELKITYVNPIKAYHASYFPGAELIAPNKIKIETENYYDIRRAMMFI